MTGFNIKEMKFSIVAKQFNGRDIIVNRRESGPK